MSGHTPPPTDDGEPAIRLVPVTGSATEQVEELLGEAGLPTADLDEAALSVAVGPDGRLVGCGGIQPLGDVGLLRSVVVHPTRRGEGHGSAIVRALETEAREAGLEHLYLLTTDAADFFARLGYERVERDSVPPEIKGSRQFADLCPSSATVMEKSLQGG